jgi:hypothetical protein
MRRQLDTRSDLIDLCETTYAKIVCAKSATFTLIEGTYDCWYSLIVGGAGIVDECAVGPSLGQMSLRDAFIRELKFTGCACHRANLRIFAGIDRKPQD